MLDTSTIRITDVGAGWTEARIAILRKLIEVDLLSANEAAAEMCVSRNAVIGKCKREKIQMSRKGHGGRLGPKGGPSQRQKRVRTGRPVVVKPTPVAPQKLVAAVPYVPAVDPLVPGTVALVDLGEGCKWPSGDPALFCGAMRMDGMPYCAGHCRMAYRAPEPRARGFYR